MKNPCVYILSNTLHTVFYTGVTSNLAQRIWQHKQGLVEGFTKNYHIHKLVYYELHDEMSQAIAREKLIKRWRREIKFEAIERMNPEWNDLYETLNQ